MTLPVTGPISLGDVNVELGRAFGAAISLQETAVRNLAGIASGPISLNDLRGKSAFSVTADNVTGVDAGVGASGPVTSGTSPNTTPVGGTAPYTYSWTYISGSTDFAVINSTVQNPTWSGANIPNGTSVAVWRVTVTDSAANSVNTTITVSLTWNQI